MNGEKKKKSEKCCVLRPSTSTSYIKWIVSNYFDFNNSLIIFIESSWEYKHVPSYSSFWPKKTNKKMNEFSTCALLVFHLTLFPPCETQRAHIYCLIFYFILLICSVFGVFVHLVASNKNMCEKERWNRLTAIATKMLIMKMEYYTNLEFFQP